MNNLLAQNLDAIQAAGLPGNVIPTSIGMMVSFLVPYIFSIAGIILLIYLVISGFQLMTSQGNPQAIQAAKSKITTALIGFLIIFLAYSLVRLIGLLLGIDMVSTIFTG